MGFDKYIEETLKLRPNYKESLNSIDFEWEIKLKKIIGRKSPEFITDIYSKYNGTDSNKPFGINSFFIPKFKLLTIDEIVVYIDYLRDINKVDNNIILIPFLKDLNRDFIGYYKNKDTNEEKIVSISFSDGIENMYDSVDSFWLTITKCLELGAFSIENNEFVTDLLYEVEIAGEYNSNSDMW